MGRPWLTDDRDEVIARIDGLGIRPPLRDDLDYPVGPQYEKGEQLQQPKREKAREMPQMQLCARMLAIMAIVLLSCVGITAKSERVMPILSLQTHRVGTFDVHTTVNILSSVDNVAVCVGLAGEKYPARWACQFVTDKGTTSIMIAWRDVSYDDYAIEAGLMQVHRVSNTFPKAVQTYRRAFGVWKI